MIEHLSEWESFILRHRHPGNLFVHFLSWLMFVGGPILAALTKNPWYLLLFFSSGAMGALGHFVFKDSGVSLREATSSVMVPVYVTRMFVALLGGNYWPQVEAAQVKAADLGHLPRNPQCP
jgi:hypothetical protein